MKTILGWLLVIAGFLALFTAYTTWFPGTNAPGRGANAESEDVAERLRRHVEYLALDVGARDKAAAVADASAYLQRELRRAGLDVKEIQDGVLAGEVPGTKHAREIVVVAAHFDGPRGSPAANAGASGAAALLEVARAAGATAHERTLRFVLFPDGARRGADAGSTATNYAEACASRGETIAAVLYLDSVGCFDDKGGGSAPFPFGLLLPSDPTVLSVVGAYTSRDLTSRATEAMRQSSGLAIEGYVLPAFVPGTAFSAHAAFLSAGFPAVAFSDTGSWRSARFGTASDTHDRLDYARMARVVQGVARVVALAVKKATLAT